MEFNFFRLIEGLAVGVIVMAVGALTALVYRAGVERSAIREWMVQREKWADSVIENHPTKKEVTDEITETRHTLRNEMMGYCRKLEDQFQSLRRTP